MCVWETIVKIDLISSIEMFVLQTAVCCKQGLWCRERVCHQSRYMSYRDHSSDSKTAGETYRFVNTTGS